MDDGRQTMGMPHPRPTQRAALTPASQTTFGPSPRGRGEAWERGGRACGAGGTTWRRQAWRPLHGMRWIAVGWDGMRPFPRRGMDTAATGGVAPGTRGLGGDQHHPMAGSRMIAEGVGP